jgi:hypothetical protein
VLEEVELVDPDFAAEGFDAEERVAGFLVPDT